MIDVTKIKGAIFDVDDTLLDNETDEGGLHELSRFEAMRQIAKTHNLPVLLTLTQEENIAAFADAKTHSLEGAIWETLRRKGLVLTDEVDYENELLKEIAIVKNTAHADILRQRGRMVPGAVDPIHFLDAQGLGNKFAIASSAVRRDIDIVLDELTDLRSFFPSERVVSKENISPLQGKPHPEPFNRAFKTLNLPDEDRQHVLAFEDDPRGVISAKAAGLYVCAITTRFAADHPLLTAAEPDMIIPTYNDFIDQLKRTSRIEND